MKPPMPPPPRKRPDDAWERARERVKLDDEWERDREITRDRAERRDSLRTLFELRAARWWVSSVLALVAGAIIYALARLLIP